MTDSSHDEMSGWALPAFDPHAARQRLRQELRALGLSERADQFEHRGLAVVRLAADGAVLRAARVRRPARRPEWTEQVLKDSAQVRDFIAGVKKALASWTEHDE